MRERTTEREATNLKMCHVHLYLSTPSSVLYQLHREATAKTWSLVCCNLFVGLEDYQARSTTQSAQSFNNIRGQIREKDNGSARRAGAGAGPGTHHLHN